MAFRLDQSLSLEEGGSFFVGPSTDFDLTRERGYVNSFSEYFLEANDYTSISINRKIDHYIAKQNIEYNKLFSTGTHIDTRDQLITRINDNDESNGRSSKRNIENVEANIENVNANITNVEANIFFVYQVSMFS